jgi:hypothetical protein
MNHNLKKMAQQLPTPLPPPPPIAFPTTLTLNDLINHETRLQQLNAKLPEWRRDEAEKSENHMGLVYLLHAIVEIDRPATEQALHDARIERDNAAVAFSTSITSGQPTTTVHQQWEVMYSILKRIDVLHADLDHLTVMETELLPGEIAAAENAYKEARGRRMAAMDSIANLNNPAVYEYVCGMRLLYHRGDPTRLLASLQTFKTSFEFDQLKNDVKRKLLEKTLLQADICKDSAKRDGLQNQVMMYKQALGHMLHTRRFIDLSREGMHNLKMPASVLQKGHNDLDAMLDESELMTDQFEQLEMMDDRVGMAADKTGSYSAKAPSVASLDAQFDAMFATLVKECMLASAVEEQPPKPQSRLVAESDNREKNKLRGVPVMMTVQSGLGGGGYRDE